MSEPTEPAPQGPPPPSPESAALARYRAAARRRRNQPDGGGGTTRFGAGRRATMRRLSQTPTGPGPDPRDPQPLGAVWGRFAQHQGWTEEIAVWSLSTGWAQIVGPQIADHVVVVRFDADAPMAEATPQDGQQTALLPGPHPEQRRSGGRLVLQADSAAWQQQLVWGLGHLQRRLDEALGRGVVGTIVVLGPGQREGRDGPRKGQGRRGPGMRRA